LKPNANRQILVIEDSFELNTILKEIFQETYAVFCAYTVVEARKILLDEKIELILCDIGLPGISGTTFISEISKDPRYCYIPVIFISGYQSKDIQLSALSSGGIDFILKPFKINELVLKVENLFRVIPPRELQQLRGGNDEMLPKNIVKEIDDILKNSFSNCHLDIGGIAEKIGMSQSTLNRKFMKESGMTLINYIRYYRLTKACELLKIGDLRIQEIATMCGFSSVSYFSRAFKQQYHASPLSFVNSAN
jgi:AraC-like DNA-binding protein